MYNIVSMDHEVQSKLSGIALTESASSAEITTVIKNKLDFQVAIQVNEATKTITVKRLLIG